MPYDCSAFTRHGLRVVFPPQAKSLGLSIVKRLQRNALCKSFWQVRTIVRVWSVSRPRGLRTAGPRQRLCAVGA